MKHDDPEKVKEKLKDRRHNGKRLIPKLPNRPPEEILKEISRLKKVNKNRRKKS